MHMIDITQLSLKCDIYYRPSELFSQIFVTLMAAPKCATIYCEEPQISIWEECSLFVLHQLIIYVLHH